MRRELLAVVLDERWLVVIEIHRACATIHEQLNDTLDFWRMVLNPKRPLPSGWHRNAFIGKHTRQSEASESATDSGQKLTPVRWKTPVIIVHQAHLRSGP